MKKLSVLLGVIILSSGISFASIDDNATSDIDLLRNQGFSESMLEVVDVAKSHDSNNTSKRYYTSRSKRKMGRAYSTIKTYIDPVQDDGLFGEHQINFSNSWDYNKNKYSSRYKKVKTTENL